MGMSAKTGKWRVFSGYKTFHDVICETNREGLSCPLSRFNPSHLGLSVNPTEMSSEVSGQCYYMGQGQETCHETCWRQMDVALAARARHPQLWATSAAHTKTWALQVALP